jgi:arabinofuranosyltransferase
MESRPIPGLGFILASLVLYAVVAFMSAWISDDAFITLRTVDNFVGGHGLTWNVAERVQVYTHPLWMFLLSLLYSFTHEPFFTSIFLGLVVSVLAVAFIALRIARTTAGALVAVALLTTSKAFVDYSTSGLENPLSHLLLALFLVYYFRAESTDPSRSQDIRRLFFAALTACLCVLNRMDCLLLVAPALLWLVIREPKKPARMGAVVAGFVPLFLWEMFSIFYYGFPFPNTAYAKLNTGIVKSLLVAQGQHYVKNSLITDPVTIATILIGVLIPFVTKNKRLRPVSVGMLLYLAYIISVGGDFMSGRLFSVPFFCAVALLSGIFPPSPKAWAPIAVIIVSLGLFAPNSPWRSGPGYGLNRDNLFDPHIIADERGYYFQRLGLYRTDGIGGTDGDPEAIRGRAARAKGRHVVKGGSIGVFGYYAGPEVHIVDELALADPLLARLPLRSTYWRIGHFARRLPDGYYKSLQTGRDVIEDPGLRKFSNAIRTVTRGPLVAPGRLAEIWRLNTGGYQETVDSMFASYRHDQNGMRAAARKEFDEAIAELETAVALDATRSAPWFELARLYHQENRLPESEQAMLMAFRLRPGQYENRWDELIEFHRTAGDVAKAHALQETAHNVYVRLGRWHENNGYAAAAIEQYENALRMPGDNSAVQERLRALRQ